jgi:N-acetylated-alpha-linked acidic dipeptidase
VSIFDRKRAASAIFADNTSTKEDKMNETSLKLGAMGSGSDYSAFIQHAGIPALNLGFGGEGNGGEYHSIYDTYHHFTTFKDPGLKYEVTLAQTAGRAVLRLANADVLPFDFSHLYKTINGYADELEKLLNDSRKSTQLENELIATNAYQLAQDPAKNLMVPKAKSEVPFLDFSPLQNALANLKRDADSLQIAYQKNISDKKANPSFNQSLYRAEQQLLNKEGLPRRDWYKHTIYAPGFYTGYGVKTMPGIREAIEQRNWQEAQQQININAEVIDRLANYLAAISNDQ